MFSVLFVLLACKDDPNAVDADGDGFDTSEDCDDGNDQVYPGAVEICNNDIDDDCDGEQPEVLTRYRDNDGDDSGDGEVITCDPAEPDTALGDGDCNDMDALIHPLADEECGNDVDEDCDGEMYLGLEWFLDEDGDGFGLDAAMMLHCLVPEGYARHAGDCDDQAPATFPGAPEVCDGVDQNCDGNAADEADADTDGVRVCADDCDDADPHNFPGNPEVCDGQDNDCDPSTLEDITDGTAWYTDADSDTYGTGTPTIACAPPPSTSAQDGDCNDAAPLVNPGAVEVCDGVDNNCSGTIDEVCPTHQCGAITEDITWAAGLHVVTCDIEVGSLFNDPTLTIEEGAVVRFEPGTAMTVGESAGKLEITDASNSMGVIFTSNATTPAPGDWNGLRIASNDSGSRLFDVTVEFAGGGGGVAGLEIDGAVVEIAGSRFQANLRNGVLIENAGANIAHSFFIGNGETGIELGTPEPIVDFTNNSFDNNPDYAALVHAVHVPDLNAPLFGGSTESVGVFGAGIAHDLTWPGLSVPYTVLSDLQVATGIEFALNGPMEIEMEPGSGISINGSLTTSGGVVIGGLDDEPWDGIRISGLTSTGALTELTLQEAGLVVEDSPSVVLDTCTLSGPGDVGIAARQSAMLTVRDSVISGYTHEGVSLTNFAALGGDFSNNTVTANGVAVRLSVESVERLLANSSYLGNDEPVVVSTGRLENSAVWEDLDGGYLIDGPLQVGGDAEPILELQDGIDMEFRQAANLAIGQSGPGGLRALGGNEGIVLRGRGTAGDWTGVRVRPDATLARFENVSVFDAGSNTNPCIDVEGGPLTLSSSTVENCGNTGVHVHDGGTLGMTGTTIASTVLGLDLRGGTIDPLAGFGSNTFQDNDEGMRVAPDTLVDLDSSNSFSGTGTGVHVDSSSPAVTRSGTWSNLGVPYLVESTPNLIDGASITVASGVQMLFSSGQSLRVGTSGPASLQADGATFSSSSANPAAGDWPGITFGAQCTGGSILNSTIAYAGQSPPNNGAVQFLGCDGTIADSTISDSASNGVYISAGTMATADENHLDCVAVALECVESE